MIKPLGDRIIIRVPAVSETTKSGIFLPTATKEKPNRGVVIAVGQGRLLENGNRIVPTVKVDDNIIFSSYAGTELVVDGESLLLLSENDVLAIIE